MSYRNPRFCYLHAALDAGSGSLAVTSGGVVDPTTSIERLRDLRSQAMTRIAQTGVGRSGVSLDQGTDIETRTNVNRLLVPEGHNLYAQRARLRLHESPDVSAWANLMFAGTGVPAGQGHAAPHVIDVEFDESQLRGLLLQTYDTPVSTNVEYGELWWTRTVQPTTGIVPRWQQNSEPNVLRSVTQGGESFNLQRGPARRVYDLEHQRISGADLALYEDLVRTVGVMGRPFWYEHPDSGDAIVVKQAMDVPGDWSVTNGTASSVTGWDGGTGVSFTPTSVATISARYTWAAEMDLRNHFASVDIHVPSSATWVSAASDIQLLLFSRVNELSAETHSATWNLAAYITDMQASSINTWWRVYLDLLKPDSVSSGGGLTLDPSRIDRIILRHFPVATSDIMQWDNFQVYDREKQPRLVELISFDKSQDSPNPRSSEGPTYTIRMQMLEVLS